MPYVHVLIRTDSTIKPCCRYKKVIHVNEVNKETIATEMNQIQSDLKNGVNLERCQRCIDEEKNGIISMRQRHNELFKDYFNNNNEIRALEVSFSKQCNSVCRMCDSFCSSKWAENKELLDFSKRWNNTKPGTTKENLLDFILSIENLSYIKIMGGEPFLSQDTQKFIKYAKKDMIVETSMNLTFFPYKNIDDLLKFKQIKLALSVDGLYKVNEYIRGVKWETVLKNIELWKKYAKEHPNLKINFNTTCQAYNVHQMFDTYMFLTSFFKTKINFLHEPEALLIKNLPETYKKNLIEYYKNLNDFPYSKMILYHLNKQGNNQLLKQYTEELDTIKKQYIKDYIPEIIL